MELNSVTVFCGASPGRGSVHTTAAARLGRCVARAGLDLVYGGASIGLMGVLADAALGEGGRVTGVIPQNLLEHEIAHTGLTELVVVTGMHERKARMADLGDAFVALPGGFGTTEEFLEALTWAQLGLHRKPCVLLDTDGYYRHLLDFLSRAAEEGFIPAEDIRRVLICDEPEEILERLLSLERATTAEVTT
ncbi:TIGR00730 family Rossman fold protein [Streptomyces bluensis]|uniref:Cytokinin riboside 5'-monophosphate phosphoribohydrolase n=1 Tax=Streptomyces bluensis TaxID=33897 RepID=A0ABW6UK48_9ACTN